MAGRRVPVVDSPVSSPRKRQRLDSDERRALILASARRLLSSRPYSDVSLADLAAAAGVTRGLLHHYFGSKRELYLEVVRSMIEVPRIPVPSADAGDPDRLAAQRWEASVDRWLDFIEANRDLWLTAVNAGGIGHDPEVASILDDSRELVSEQALAAMGIDDPTPTVRALMRGFGGFTEEATREWLVRGRLTRAQVRVLLVGAIPMLVRELLPLVADDAGGAAIGT